MPKPEPLEARYDGCEQMRPVFKYEPDCGLHLDPGLQFFCRWCKVEEQPLLCIRCYDKRKLAEEEDNRVSEDYDLLCSIAANNERIMRRKDRDTEQVQGIAKASGIEVDGA